MGLASYSLTQMSLTRSSCYEPYIASIGFTLIYITIFRKNPDLTQIYIKSHKISFFFKIFGFDDLIFDQKTFYILVFDLIQIIRSLRIQCFSFRFFFYFSIFWVLMFCFFYFRYYGFSSITDIWKKWYNILSMINFTKGVYKTIKGYTGILKY